MTMRIRFYDLTPRRRCDCADCRKLEADSPRPATRDANLARLADQDMPAALREYQRRLNAFHKGNQNA